MVGGGRRGWDMRMGGVELPSTVLLRAAEQNGGVFCLFCFFLCFFSLDFQVFFNFWVLQGVNPVQVLPFLVMNGGKGGGRVPRRDDFWLN